MTLQLSKQRTSDPTKNRYRIMEGELVLETIDDAIDDEDAKKKLQEYVDRYHRGLERTIIATIKI
jgi:hypothetical protein